MPICRAHQDWEEGLQPAQRDHLRGQGHDPQPRDPGHRRDRQCMADPPEQGLPPVRERAASKVEDRAETPGQDHLRLEQRLPVQGQGAQEREGGREVQGCGLGVRQKGSAEVCRHRPE